MDQPRTLADIDTSKLRARDVLLILIERACGHFLRDTCPTTLPRFDLAFLRNMSLPETIPFSATGACGQIKWLHPSMIACLEDIEADIAGFNAELIERQIAFFYDHMMSSYSSFIDVSEGEIYRTIEGVRQSVRAFTAKIPAAMPQIRSAISPGQAFWQEMSSLALRASPEAAYLRIDRAAEQHGLDHEAAWSIAARALGVFPWVPSRDLTALPSAMTCLACAASRLVSPHAVARPAPDDLAQAMPVFAAYSDALAELGSNRLPGKLDLPSFFGTIVCDLAHRDTQGLVEFCDDVIASDWAEGLALRLEHGFLLAAPRKRLAQIVCAIECAIDVCDTANHLRMRIAMAAEARLAEVGVDVVLRIDQETVTAIPRVD